MKTYTGKSIFDGIAIGKVKIYHKGKQTVTRTKVDDVETEIARFEAAKEKAVEQLGTLYEKAVEKVGELNATIFEVHQMMLKDDNYIDSVYNIIRSEEVNAEYAVATAGEHFSRMFAEMEDEYFKARALDVKDISERVVNVLSGANDSVKPVDEPVILVADDLTPSEIVKLDRSKLLAFVILHGSSNSHTAILARTMNIPALIGVEPDKSWNEQIAIVDGKKGVFIVNPNDSVLEEYMEEKRKGETELLTELKGLVTVTKDGREVRLYANIGSVADITNVLANDAEGIGLFRSEFLYLEKEDYPAEEEQFSVYKTVAQKMAGKKVIIRTFDIRVDKQIEDCVCLDRIEVFKAQLRALYRVSVFGKISVMFPMITSVAEVKEIKRICEEVKAELDEKSIMYEEVELGIMIETPEAVMISDLLAKEVDFFSIGTNDLTQYTLGIDRQNSESDNIYDAPNPAIMRMIQRVIDSGHSHGCWVGICGELGADLSLTEEFVNMGIDELSVSPSFILPIRKIIREM